MIIYIFWAVLIFVSALIESTFLALPFTLFLVFSLIVYGARRATFLAFSAGIILDVFYQRFAGADSLFFLTVLLIWRVFSQKITEGRLVYRFIFWCLILPVYEVLFYRFFTLSFFLRAVILGGILLFILTRMLPEPGDRGKLAVN